MNTHRIETITVKLPSGASTGSVTQSLPKGRVLGVNVFMQSPSQNDLFLNVAIKDDNGVSVNKSADLRFYLKREGGAFSESYVPIKDETNGKTYIFEVSIATGSGLPTADKYIQFVLIYENNPKC